MEYDGLGREPIKLRRNRSGSFWGASGHAFDAAGPAGHDPIVWTGRALQAESAERE
jgi:hypothetical protein